MNWKNLFQKRMFWLILTPVILFYLYEKVFNIETYGVNKTVGWAFNIHDIFFINAYLLPISFFVSIIGYGVLALLKKKTNLKTSMIHFCFLVLSLFFSYCIDLLGVLGLIVNLSSVFLIFVQYYLIVKKQKL